jgi:DNA polymerase-4
MRALNCLVPRLVGDFSLSIRYDKRRLTRYIIHVDLDAFFTSVEELLDPSLKGKPIIVGADPKLRGVVATASYAARRYGVHSAMPSRTAGRLCPLGIFLPVRKEVYQEYSQKVMAIFRGYSPLVEKVSIDEAFLDVTQKNAPFSHALDIGHDIQDRIRSQIGLPCSVGIGTNKLVAKIASDLRKPQGFVAVPPGQERKFLAPLPVGRLWGVGPRTESFLKSMGIRTIGDLSQVSSEKLSFLGKRGAILWRQSQGLDEREVEVQRPIKSVGREHTFNEDTEDQKEVEATLTSLVLSVSDELSRLGFKGRTITLKLRYPDFTTHTFSKTQHEATSSKETIQEQILWLFHSHWEPRKLRLVGVRVSMLA